MKYGFIGCGNMGGALAKALSHATKQILICDHSKAEAVASSLGCRAADVKTVARECDIIFIGTKPNKVKEALSPIQELLNERKPMLISMAAGLTLSTVESYAGTSLPIVRIMPNTPVSVGKGMIGYTCNTLVNRNTLSDFLSDMRFAGVWDEVEEALMDTVSALSGSGPAYMYHFVELLCEGAAACGMAPEQALTYAITTMEGAAEMLRTSGQTPEALRIAVCSPGGSTLAGLRAMEDGGFDTAVVSGIKAAYDRNKELATM